MKASTIIIALLIVSLFAVAILAATMNTQPIPNQGTVQFPLTITIDGSNYTNGTTLQWGNLLAGYTTSKNFTLTNVANATYTTYIIANPPTGTTMTWAGNNTVLGSTERTSEWLNWTATPQVVAGDYNWTITVLAEAT